MINTKIQWCHSTVNPVMGCDGCELWPTPTAIRSALLPELLPMTSMPKEAVQKQLAEVFDDRTTSEVYRDREEIAEQLTKRLKGDSK